MTQRLTPPAPVFALHASASSPSQWLRLKDDLRNRNTVTGVDLRSRFDVIKNEGSDSTLADVAQFVIAMLQGAGGPVHLVGHSFGGAVALKIAMTRPDLVASLTLYEPAALFLANRDDAEEANALDAILRIRDDLTATINAGQPETGIRQFIAYWNGADRWDAMPESTHQRLTKAAPSVVQDFKAGFSETATMEDLALIDAPTLIMSGMDSPILGQRLASRIASAIPNARLAILPSLGHMAPLTDPEWVNPRICQHIAEVERNATRLSWPTHVAA